jgi:molybdopterin-binding protein
MCCPEKSRPLLRVRSIVKFSSSWRPHLDVVAIITKVSAEKLKLQAGTKVYTIIKASNVMIGVD